MAGLVFNLVVIPQSPDEYTLSDFHPSVGHDDMVQWTAPDDSAVTLLLRAEELLAVLPRPIQPGPLQSLAVHTRATHQPPTCPPCSPRPQARGKTGRPPSHDYTVQPR